jgi:hypothetical protein
MTKGHVYTIQLREHLDTSIYKIGQTQQEDPSKRMAAYPKQSKVYDFYYSDNCKLLEKEIIKLFTVKYKQRRDIGNEYFEGKLVDMLNDIWVLRNFINNSNEEVNKANIDTEELNNKLKELKQETKHSSLKLKVIKTEKKLEDIKLRLQEESTLIKEQMSQSIYLEEIKEWFSNNFELDPKGKVSLQKIIKEGPLEKEEIMRRFKLLGHKYKKDLSGLGKDEDGNYYKGGFEGITSRILERHFKSLLEYDT